MMSEPDQDGNTHRIVQRDYHRPKPVTKTLKHLRRVAKSAEHTLGRKMATLEGGQYVLLVKALRQNRSGQVHGACIVLVHCDTCHGCLFVQLTEFSLLQRLWRLSAPQV